MADDGWWDADWSVLVEHDYAPLRGGGLGSVLAEREPSRTQQQREPSRPLVPDALAEADLRSAQLTAKLRGPPKRCGAPPEACLRFPEVVDGDRLGESDAEASGAEPVFKIMVFEHMSEEHYAHAGAARGEWLGDALGEAHGGGGPLDGGVFPNVLCWSTCHACLKGELRLQAVPGQQSQADLLMAQALSRPDPCPNHARISAGAVAGDLDMDCPMCRQWIKAQETAFDLRAGIQPDKLAPREESTASCSSYSQDLVS